MNKKIFVPVCLAGCLMWTGCTTTSGSQGTQSALAGALLQGSTQQAASNAGSTQGSGLAALLSSVLGGSLTLSEQSIRGTWNYVGADCVFESENWLMKAGGEVAATRIEKELNSTFAKIGIKQGACSYTFNADRTYTAVIGGRTIQGTYTLNAQNKTIELTYLAGLKKMTAHVAMQGGKLSLLVDSSKLLAVLKAVSALSSGSTLQTASSLLSQYDGMLIGMQMSK